MSTIDPGTILITGPTGGLGRAATLAMANRPAAQRPDLILVGRPGAALAEVADAARAAGADAHAVGCDLGRLAEVRAAAGQVRDLLGANTVRPLRGLVANAGVSVLDTRTASADGYELTFAVNHLAHAQLIGDLVDSLSAPARIVLLGSNTYYENLPRRILGVAAAEWRDPIELARPAAAGVSPSMRTGGVAYSNSKLAILYYAHELQRHVPQGVSVIVFEPGFMPGTGLGRAASPALQRAARGVGRIPGVSAPRTSGPALASVALDDRWSHLRDGAFVVIDRERDVRPFAVDRARESRLWDATAELLKATE
ncbi:NAD(P)-dependent dehydrogenase (short-subunit alcohol dehydrogenase family) [Nocardia sp. GAS34]|uniref:SDR family NAD(P)-dependent oxidoreductase n=1 Tax=unclassified Nocardia TaxID=2637762 RepID=UPI003D1BB1F6